MKKKSAFRILFPVILITVIVAITFLSTSWYVNRYIRIRLQNEFADQTSGTYVLTIGSLRLNLLAQSIIFRNITIKPVKKDTLEPSYSATAKAIEFKGVNTIGFLRSKKINVSIVDFRDPSISITRGKAIIEREADTSKRFSLYSLIEDFAQSLTIEKLDVSNFDFKLFNDPQAKTPSLHSRDNNFRIINLHVGKPANGMNGIFEADSIALKMNRFSYTTADSLYTFDVGSMGVSYKDSLLIVDSINVIPNFSKRKFGAAAGEQIDRFDISARQLLFNKIDLRHFFEYQNMIAANLEIHQFNMLASRDKNYIREYAKPESLQALLRGLPGYLRIDTISIAGSNIAYEEIAEGKNVPGRITFNDINGNFIGLTNDSLLIAKGKDLVLKANCRLMDEGKLYATYTFPLNTTQMVFSCSGFLVAMPMTVLNKMIGPLTDISIKDGFIDTLDFAFEAGENTSNGKMKFVYHDLKLEPHTPEDGNIKFKNKMSIFIANTFILKERNPKGNKPPTIVSMGSERNKERFIFNYTWKTLFSGIKETVGIPDIK